MKKKDGTSPRIAENDDEIYRLLVENADESIYVVRKGVIRFANPKSAKVSGYSREELLGMPVANLIHPEDREWVTQRHVLRSGERAEEDRYVHRIITKQDRVRWIEVNAVRIRWKGKSAIMVFATDVTDRKMAEDALWASERRYRSLFYSAPSGIFFYDKDLRLVEANGRFMAAAGRTEVSIVGMNLGRIYDRRIVPCLSKPLSGEEGKYVGGFRKDRDSEELWLFINTLPVHRADGDLIGGIGIFQDLTDWKKKESMLRERESELHLKSHQLEEANTALQAILRHSKEELSKLQSNILTNIEEMVIPLFNKIRENDTTGKAAGCLDLVEYNLREITSPFVRNLSLGYYNLTRQEKRIAGLIRKGLKTSEIADLLGLSQRSVEHHRYKLRTKLGLRGSKTNLRTFLLSLGGEG